MGNKSLNKQVEMEVDDEMEIVNLSLNYYMMIDYQLIMKLRGAARLASSEQK